jgi:hypothetical protein
LLYEGYLAVFVEDRHDHLRVEEVKEGALAALAIWNGTLVP